MDLMGGQFGSTVVRREPVDDDIDYDEDETVTERLWGLTEMFPTGVRRFVANVADYSWSGVCTGFNLSRVVIWTVSTTAMIAFLPYILEKEMADHEMKTLENQKRILLGPQSVNTSQKGGMGLGPVMGLAPGAK